MCTASTTYGENHNQSDVDNFQEYFITYIGNISVLNYWNVEKISFSRHS